MSHFLICMRRRHTRKKRPKKCQKGGIVPLAAIVPFLAAGAKAAALGATSGGSRHSKKTQTNRWCYVSPPKKIRGQDRRRSQYVFVGTMESLIVNTCYLFLNRKIQ